MFEQTRKGIVDRIARNTASNAVLRVATAVMGFISLPILVRCLGAEQNGLLILAGTVMGYFTLLGLSVPTSITKYISEYSAAGNEQGVRDIVNTAFYFYAAVGLLASVLVGLFVQLNGLSLFGISPEKMDAARRLMYIAGFWAIVSWPAGVFANALIGLHRTAENNVAVGVGAIVSSALSIAVALKGYGVSAVFLAQGFGVAVSWVWQYRLLRALLPGWGIASSGFSADVFRRMFRFSAWLMLSQVGTLLMYQTDKIILGLLLPVSALTIYQVVVMPFQRLKSLQDVFTSALFPAVSALGAMKEGAVQHVIQKSEVYVCMISGVMGLMGVIFARPFIRVWMGESFVPYAWIAQMMCAFLMLQGSNGARYLSFVALGHVRNLSLIAITVSVLNVPIGVFMTYRIGVGGVLFATVVAGIVSLLLQYRFVYPALAMTWKDHLRGVLKGQSIFWFVALAFFPFWGMIQRMDGLPEVLAAGAVVGTIFAAAGWFFVMEQEHKKHIFGLWPLRAFRRTPSPAS